MVQMVFFRFTCFTAHCSQLPCLSLLGTHLLLALNLLLLEMKPKRLATMPESARSCPDNVTEVNRRTVAESSIAQQGE